MRRVSLLLALAALVCLAVLVSGAGHSQRKGRMPLPEGARKTFPTKAEIAADHSLKAKYGGDNKIVVHVGQCRRPSRDIRRAQAGVESRLVAEANGW
jgi:hypothetical protein